MYSCIYIYTNKPRIIIVQRERLVDRAAASEPESVDSRQFEARLTHCSPSSPFQPAPTDPSWSRYLTECWRKESSERKKSTAFAKACPKVSCTTSLPGYWPTFTLLIFLFTAQTGVRKVTSLNMRTHLCRTAAVVYSFSLVFLWKRKPTKRKKPKNYLWERQYCVLACWCEEWCPSQWQAVEGQK